MTATPKPRITYIDVAKGILICCLLYGHIRVYGPMDGLQDDVMQLMSKTGPLYGAFFMQTFFIITGFCSSFKVGFKNFLWKNIKTLLIPSILLFLFSEYYKMIVFQADNHPFVLLLDWLTTGGPWFIITMFWAKIIYYGIYKLSVKYQIALMGLLYFSGLVLPHFHVINYQWHQHVFLMIPYLYVGTWCKAHVDVMERYLKPVAYFGALSIVLQNFIAQLGGAFIRFPNTTLE